MKRRSDPALESKSSEPAIETKRDKMQFGRIPTGTHKLPPRTIGMMADLPILRMEQHYFRLLVDGREISVAQDMAKSQEGVWGSSFAVSRALYVDTATVIDKQTQERIEAAIRSEFAAPDGYIKFE
jgi:hypothetical protein